LSTESGGKTGTGVEKVFEDFNKSWMTYWDAYVDLQNQLYESIKTAREVSWLAATDTTKMSEINSAQRELFSSMPRRVDYVPLGQISRDLDSAVSKLEELETALSVEKEKCKRLELATDVLLERAKKTKEELLAKK
jgi:diphthamide synthase subunit DPH2